MKLVIKIVFLLVLYGQSLFAEESLVFSAINDSIDSEISGQILREAYDRLGINITIKKYPGVRSIQYSNTGVTDGETNRVGGVEEIYDNLIAVPVIISEIAVHAYTNDPNIKISGIGDIDSYKVGIRRGAKFAEKIADELDQAKVYRANSELNLYKMLASNRVDLIIAPEKSTLFAMENMENVSFYASPVLKRLPLYHYLNKSFEYLVPGITRILQEMKDEGRIDEIKESVIESMLE